MDNKHQDSPSNESGTPRDMEYSQFVHLFSRNSHRIFAFIYSLLPYRSDAEDVFQQTSLILWRDFSRFDQDRSFAAWANGIAFNTVRNFQRTRARSRLIFSEKLMSALAQERSTGQVESDQRRDALDDCIHKLPAADRDLVQHIYEDGTSIKEHAKSIGRAVQTLYNRLNLIRNGLLECIDRTLSAREGTA